MGDTYCPKCGKFYSGHYCSCVREQRDLEDRREQERRNHELMIEQERQFAEDEREERMRKLLVDQQENVKQIADDQKETQQTLEKERDFKDFKKGFLNLLTEHIDILADPAGDQIGQNEIRDRKLKAWQKKADLWLTVHFFDPFDHNDEYSKRREDHILKTNESTIWPVSLKDGVSKTNDLPIELVSILTNGFIKYFTAKVNEAESYQHVNDDDESDNIDSSSYYDALNSIEGYIWHLQIWKCFSGAFDGIEADVRNRLNEIEDENERIAAEEATIAEKAQEDARIAAEQAQQQAAIQQVEQEKFNEHIRFENERSERTTIVITLLVASNLLTWAIFSVLSLHSKLSHPSLEWSEITKELVGYYDFLFVKPMLAVFYLANLISGKVAGSSGLVLLNYSLVVVIVVGTSALIGWLYYICIKKAVLALKKAAIPLFLMFLLGHCWYGAAGSYGRFGISCRFRRRA